MQRATYDCYNLRRKDINTHRRCIHAFVHMYAVFLCQLRKTEGGHRTVAITWKLETVIYFEYVAYYSSIVQPSCTAELLG